MSNRIFFALLFLIGTGPLPAQTSITIGSQNTLHYGWGSTRPNRIGNSPGKEKVQAIWNTTIAGNTIGLLQEVMPPADLGAFTGCIPGHCLVFPSNFYGRGSYRERYVFFLLEPQWPANIRECAAAFANNNACRDFSRPPAALEVTLPNARTIAVLNFHAVWGKTVAGRTNEANRIGQLIFSRNQATIVGGDWNLNAATVEDEVVCNRAQCVAPTGLTTINPSGQMSSSYDHFYWTRPFTRVSAAVLPPPSPGLAAWRKIVSDHLGIAGEWSIR